MAFQVNEVQRTEDNFQEPREKHKKKRRKKAKRQEVSVKPF